MDVLNYLNENFILNRNEEKVKEKKKFFDEIKKSFSKKKDNKPKEKITYTAKNLEEINAVLFKESIVKEDKYKTIKLKSAFVMTSTAEFYYFNEDRWEGPFSEPLFSMENNYYQQLKMVANISNRYYLCDGRLLNINRLFDYNSKISLSYISGVGFPYIFSDAGSNLKYIIDKSMTVDKNEYSIVDNDLIEEVFNDNLQKKYKCFYKIEYAKDNSFVIRVFLLDNKTCVEIYRAYIYENHTETFFRVGDSFFKEDTRRDLAFLRKMKSGYIDESIIENTNAKYFVDVLKKNNKERFAEKVLIILKYPFIEKLYNAGWIRYANILCNKALEGDYALERKIYELFYSSIDPYNVSFKELKLVDLFKLNKHQTKVLKDYVNNKSSIDSIIFRLRQCLDCNLATIDDKTFDNVFNTIIDFDIKYKDFVNKDNMNHIYRSIRTLRNVYSLEKSFKIMEDFIASFKSHQGYCYMYSYYCDILDMLNELNLLENHNIKVKDEHQLDVLHTEVMNIYNSVKKQYENKKFIEKLDKVKYLEFEDDNFKVVVPTCCEDLINEGTTLHHCVASYINKVIKDTTNIVFIRKKPDLEKPFFTVEVSNYKSIEQVHGFGNSNVEDDDLKKFIDKWIEEKGLTLNDINKVR